MLLFSFEDRLLHKVGIMPFLRVDGRRGEVRIQPQ